LRVPEDISVVGFDDIPGAAYANPGLTTVRQPLIRMGQIAAQTVVDQIEGRGEYVPEIAIEPELWCVNPRASRSATIAECGGRYASPAGNSIGQLGWLTITPPPPVSCKSIILNKVLCFDRLLQVLILPD